MCHALLATRLMAHCPRNPLRSPDPRRPVSARLQLTIAARLVDVHDEFFVLQTPFPLPVGEHVRVDRRIGDQVGVLWGEVIQGRAGVRVEDQGQGGNFLGIRI